MANPSRTRPASHRRRAAKPHAPPTPGPVPTRGRGLVQAHAGQCPVATIGSPAPMVGTSICFMSETHETNCVFGRPLVVVARWLYRICAGSVVVAVTGFGVNLFDLQTFLRLLGWSLVLAVSGFIAIWFDWYNHEVLPLPGPCSPSRWRPIERSNPSGPPRLG